MQLWTYHPANFRVDDHQSPGIDPTKGRYWNEPTLRYESCLRLLLKMLDTEQFPLWCFTLPDRWQLTDPTNGPIEWELVVPEREVLAFIRGPIWDSILHDQSEDWQNVIVKERPFEPAEDISAVVRFPLLPEWGVICHGRVVDKAWRSEAETLARLPAQAQRQRIQKYRDLAVNWETTAASRNVAANRADYLEEFLNCKAI